MTLDHVCQRTGLSERWIRELIKRHGLRIRTIPWPGGYRFVFTGADVKRIWAIHQRNQVELQRRHPQFYAKVGKVRLLPTRSPWDLP